MKNLKDVIQEKLVINKDTKLVKQNLRDVSNFESPWKLNASINAFTIDEKIDMMDKINTYHSINGNPKRLYNIKSKIYTIVNLLICAILDEWDKGIETYRNEILDTSGNNNRNYFGNISHDNWENLLDGFIYNKLYKNKYFISKCGNIYFRGSKQTNGQTDEKILKHFEHYFELYNIKY